MGPDRQIKKIFGPGMQEEKPRLDYGTNPVGSSWRSFIVLATAVAVTAALLVCTYLYVFSSWHDMPP